MEEIVKITISVAVDKSKIVVTGEPSGKSPEKSVKVPKQKISRPDRKYPSGTLCQGCLDPVVYKKRAHEDGKFVYHDRCWKKKEAEK